MPLRLKDQYHKMASEPIVPDFGDDESECLCEDCSFDNEYPNASCHDCGTKLNGHTVEFCSKDPHGCQTWYCSECIEEREFPWCCEQCENYTGSDCKNCGHTLTAEELAEGIECCDKPNHLP